jgi:DNA (cytosine-5)-methyltransferase 1
MDPGSYQARLQGPCEPAPRAPSFRQDRHSGLYLPASAPRRPVAVDLFCGCGGMGLGLHLGGFDVVAASDYDASAAFTYMVNLCEYGVQIVYLDETAEARLEKQVAASIKVRKENPGIPFMPTAGSAKRPDINGCKHFFLGDIRNLTGAALLKTIGYEVGEIDLVAGGPPCQGYSAMGKREVMDPRNSLVFEFARLVCEIKPKTMLMENVPGIVSMKTPEGVPVVDALCRVLEDGGFGAWDSLKSTLLSTSGSGAALRGTNAREQNARAQIPAESLSPVPEAAQLELF